MARKRQQQAAGLGEITGLNELSPIGRGASSTVYRAHDEELNRWVAVKVFEADDPSDPARKRFRREREITANLGKHPHIVQVLGTGFTSTGLPYVVMELFERGSIADRIRTLGTYSAAETIDIGIKIADAAEAAHQAGVLHRDIKPQNVLISEYGPALADFGIARSSTSLEWSQSLDQITPMHAPPEVLLGEGPTARSDVYSIGSTLYTMLAGRPPHAGPPGETLLQYQVRAAQGVVPDIARVDVPQSLVSVIMTALAKDPAVRYPSPGALRDALKELGGERSQPTPEPEPSIASAEPATASPTVDISAPTSPFAPAPGQALPLVPGAPAALHSEDLGADMTVDRASVGSARFSTATVVPTPPRTPDAVVPSDAPSTTPERDAETASPWAMTPPSVTAGPVPVAPGPPPMFVYGTDAPEDSIAASGLAAVPLSPAAPTSPFDTAPERFDASSTVLRHRDEPEAADEAETPERHGPSKALLAGAAALVVIAVAAVAVLASGGTTQTPKRTATPATHDAALDPVGLTANVSGAGTVVTLNWTSPNPGNVGFVVGQQPGGGPFASIGATTTYHASGLTSGTGYCFLVLGLSRSANSVGGSCACINQGKPKLPKYLAGLTCSQA